MALSFLDSLKAQRPQVADDCSQLATYFEKKYWHEITELIKVVLFKPEWDDVELQTSFYTGFITHFQLRLNLFSLAEILVTITNKQTDEKALESLVAAAALVKEQGNKEAYLLLRCEEAIRRVHISVAEGTDVQKRQAKDIIEEATVYLSKRDASSVHTDLRAQIYLAEAAVFKMEKKHGQFYERCLLYIAHTNTAKLPQARQRELAFDLGVSALLARNVHNFGELVHHPVLDTLKGSENEWLADLLRTFNVGDIQEYDRVCKENEARMKTCLGESAQAQEELRSKFRLMSLLYHLFVTPVDERTLSFEVIKEKCRTALIEDVEPLLLRALALELIRGSIDEVNQTIQVTWIASRALGKEEVAGLARHMATWIKQVNQIHQEAESTVARCESEA